MVNFVNPLNPQQNPVDTTYASITFTGLIQLLWSKQNITEANEYYVATTTIVSGTLTPVMILPNVQATSNGSEFMVINIGATTIPVLSFDGSSIINIESGQAITFIVTDTTPTGAQSTAWRTILIGTTTNTNTLSQNLGNTLTFIASTNNIQTKQMVTTIQSALAISGGNYLIDTTAAVTYSGTILYNPNTVKVQTNILLSPSNTLYGACGFSCTFVNEAAYPVVLQTQGDTINGVTLQSTTNSASFVLIPGGSVTLSATSNNNWLIASQSLQYQNIFKSATFNWSTANYSYLAQSANAGFVATNILPNSTGAAAVAIDMSSNLDLIYSPLWVLEGAVPPAIASLMTSLNQTTVWIILPNNLSFIYFIQARLSTPNYKVGLAVKYGTGTSVGLPPLSNAFSGGSQSTLPFQYSAQVDPSAVNLPNQFISGLIFGSGGGGGGTSLFPDITDDVDSGLVSIIGQGGLRVTSGPARFEDGAFVNGPGGSLAVATIVPSPLTAGNYISTDTNGYSRDSGTAFTTDVTLGGINSNNTKIPTELAVKTYVQNTITGFFDFKGGWSGATNTPTLTQGAATAGDAYIVTADGTQAILDPVLYPPSGSFDFVEGDYVLGGSSGEWVVLDGSIYVTSVNGQTGTVILNLGQINDVVISGPLTGEGIIYNSGTGKWENGFPSILGITANGTNVTVTLPFICQDQATIDAGLNVTGQTIFSATEQPPLFTGGYGDNPSTNSLATIGYVIDNLVTYPDITDSHVPGSPEDSEVTVNAKLIVAFGATFNTTLDVNEDATFHSTLTVSGLATMGQINAANIELTQNLGVQAISITNPQAGTGFIVFSGGGGPTWSDATVMRGKSSTGEGTGLIFGGAGTPTPNVYAERTGSELLSQNDLAQVALITIPSTAQINGSITCATYNGGIFATFATIERGYCNFSFVINLTNLTASGAISQVPLTDLLISDTLTGVNIFMLPLRFSVAVGVTASAVQNLICNVTLVDNGTTLQFECFTNSTIPQAGTITGSGLIVWA